MTPLPVADRWFERTRIDDATTLMVEPHVVALMRCNIWYVKGRDRDLIVDTGMGLSQRGWRARRSDRQACHRRRHARAR